MALSKIFAMGEILSAADLNTHAVNHVPAPGDPVVVDWINIPITDAGFTVPDGATPPQLCRVGLTVYGRGVLSNNAFTGGYTTIGQLPPGIPAPTSPQGAVGSASQNSPARASIRIQSNGNVQLYRDGGSGAWLTFASISYPTI